MGMQSFNALFQGFAGITVCLDQEQLFFRVFHFTDPAEERIHPVDDLDAAAELLRNDFFGYFFGSNGTSAGGHYQQLNGFTGHICIEYSLFRGLKTGILPTH